MIGEHTGNLHIGIVMVILITHQTHVISLRVCVCVWWFSIQGDLVLSLNILRRSVCGSEHTKSIHLFYTRLIWFQLEHQSFIRQHKNVNLITLIFDQQS